MTKVQRTKKILNASNNVRPLALIMSVKISVMSADIIRATAVPLIMDVLY